MGFIAQGIHSNESKQALRIVDLIKPNFKKGGGGHRPPQGGIAPLTPTYHQI
jgi:hypothetical protein